MSYYKMGCGSPVAVNSQVKISIDEQKLRGRLPPSVAGLPEPFPTLILWGLLSVGAILWVKGGGGLGIL